MRYPFLELDKVNAPYMDEMKKAMARVIDSGRYIGGREVEIFEENLAELSHVPYVVGVSNGLDALRLILRGYVELGRLAKGDEIIVPANTYIASFLAIVDAGLTPVPVDPDPVTHNLDSALVESNISHRTKAIMPVHLYGRVCWDNRLTEISTRHNLIIVEDNAQAIGAQSPVSGLFGTHTTGSLGHAAGFSFYPTKNIGALGDAGAVATHDRDLADIVRALANYGSFKRYHNIYAGFNCRMDPIQAAMLNVKLRHVNDENAARFARAVAYDNTITHGSVTKPLITRYATDCVWHQYVIRVTDGKRDALQSFLYEHGVGTDIHYPTPPHLQPCFAKTMAGYKLPVAERLASEVLSLPISPATSVKDASDIARIINEFKA